MSHPMPAAPPDSDMNTAPRPAARLAATGDAEDIALGELVAEGRYRIESVLGQGGMATVFRAKDLQRGREIALKVIARRYVGRPDREQRFENEGRFAGRLKGHRNIAAPLQLGRLAEHGGRMFLAMELARGPTLLDLVSMHGRLPVEEACAYVRDIARALRDLHAGGVVHRDIKPSNVIVVESDDGPIAKLVDFGLAADAVPGGEGERLTKVDERPGTHHYMSPEQAWGAPAHPIFDVYALGVTFYELLVGEPPFHDLTAAEVLRRKCDLSLPAPSISGKRHDIPASLAALIDGCLAPRSTDRVATASAFLQRLDEIRAAEGIAEVREGENTGVVGVARTVDHPKKEPRLKKIVAEAAAAKAEGRPGPAELTPIRTGATRPEIAADRVALARAVARGGTVPVDAADAAVVAAARGKTEIAAAARGHTSITPAAEPPRPAGRVALYGLLAGAVVGAGGIAAWWMTSRPPKEAAAVVAGRDAQPSADHGARSGSDDAPPSDTSAIASAAAAADAGARIPDDAESTPGEEETAPIVDGEADDGVADDDAAGDDPAGDDPADDGGKVQPAASDDGSKADDDGGHTPTPSPKADGGGAPAPAVDAWTPARCADERAAAEKALAGGRFAGALGHTRIRKCWPQESERQRIRVLAFFELLRYDDCIAAGEGSSDPTIARTVRRCQKARDAKP